MEIHQLVAQLIETGEKSRQISLLKKNSHLISLELAENIKNTYYESWTTDPRKTHNAANALKYLYRLLPAEQIRALMYWVKAIALLTKGQTEKSVFFLDAAADIFNTLLKPHQAAQTQVAKLYVLALLGRYDETINVGEKALKIFEEYGDDLAAGKIEMNLGNLVLRRSLYQKAEVLFLSARSRFIKTDEKMWLAMCENDLAIVYSAINDFQRADRFYRQSLLHATAEQMSVTVAEIEASMGNLATHRGKFDEALKFLESSRQKYNALKMPHQAVVAELEIADVYLELNLLNEAFEIYERVVKKLSALKMQSEQARARANFGRVAIALDKPKRARFELRKAAKLYLAEKNPVGAATVKINETLLELSLNNFDKALSLTHQAENLLKKTGSLRHLLTSRWLRGEALRNLKQNTESVMILKKTFSAALRNEQMRLAQAVQNSLGKLFVARNDLARAERHFKKAIEITETLRAPLPAEEFRMSFMADKLAPYQELTKIYLKRGKIEQAFLMTENSRARALSEMLDEPIKPAAGGAAAHKLSGKLADLREELNWFYSRLNRAEDDAGGTLQREVRRREQQIAELMRQIASVGESVVNLRHKAGLNLKKLREQLGADNALVEYVVIDERISAFVVTAQKIEFIENLCAQNDILPLLQGLRFQFGALRYGAGKLTAFLPELKKRADFYLAELHRKIFAPLEDSVKARALTIVPACELHYVPFNALFDGRRYLIEKAEVSFAPSATVFQLCAAKPPSKFETALLMAFADERIPLVNREIASLEKYFKKTKTMAGEQATTSAFMNQAQNFDVLHLACHGEFRPDNPLFSSLRLADGAITVRDVCSQKLTADLVTLSACETGLNSVYAGDEILGLARGFLSAGVSSLILSLWTVNDEATADLMNLFYARLQTESASKSLRLAQIEFIRNNSHPYFWSSFIISGKW